MNYEIAKDVFLVFLYGLIPFLLFVTLCRERFALLRYSMFSHSIEKGELPHIHEVFVDPQVGELSKLELPIYLFHLYGKPFGDLVQDSVLACREQDLDSDPSPHRDLDILVRVIVSLYSSQLRSIRVVKKSILDDHTFTNEIVSKIAVSHENSDLYWKIC